MKVVKVRIRRGDQTLGEPMMVYPAGYNSHQIDSVGVGPTGVAYGYSGHIGEGASEEFCFIVLPDALADQYALSDDMEIVTAAAAEAEVEATRIRLGLPAQLVRAPDRIAAIQAKLAAGIALTQEDSDALDPTKDTPGINNYRRIGTMITRSTTAEADIATRKVRPRAQRPVV